VLTKLILAALLATTAPSTAPTTQPLKPVPLLTPEQEAQTFNLPEGLRAEVVASEPMVQHPVAIAWDPDGRLFVAEMRNYMPDLYGSQELKPTGRISILEDTNHDGRMDKSTVFLDHLVLPRAIGFAYDGVLVGTPPNLLFCRDTNHDGKCDEQQIIATNFGVPENPENFANGLLHNIDNQIYNADHTQRLSLAAPRAGRVPSPSPSGRGQGEGARENQNVSFTFSPIPNLGQWGISHDDWGRLFFNANSDHLRASLIPPHYSSRNPSSPMAIADTQIAKDQTVFPSHASTENRGYRANFLREDGTLKEFTAACSPHIYRGDLLPPDFYGNAFICEATANLVRRSIITEKDGKLSATNAYNGKEFIASTYERFRPTSIQTGPDGALYIVDMHHGIIQHKMSLTPYARDQYKAKQLDQHLRTGRIFRIVPQRDTRAGIPPVHSSPRFSSYSTQELVQQLTHPSAWWRDTSQRFLVEKKDPTTIEPLQRLARTGKSPIHRLQALWTLDGMDQLDDTTLEYALHDPNPKIRANAIRLAERQPHLLPEVLELSRDPDIDVLLQFTLSLSAVPEERAESALAKILHDHADNPMLRQAAISGLAHRETIFLTRLLHDPTWSTRTDAGDARATVLTDIARSITRRKQPDEMLALTDLIASAPSPSGRGQGEGTLDNQRFPKAQPPDWQSLALLESIPETPKDTFGFSRPLPLQEKPKSLDLLAASTSDTIRQRAAKVDALFTWPGKPAPPRPPVKPLTIEEQKLFDLGKVRFEKTCAQCHKSDGQGQEGKAPPLAGSPWAQGPESRLIRIVLHGAKGPFQVGDKTWNLDMPAWQSALDDTTIAAILTYIRRSFGHEANPIDPTKVQSIRDWGQARRDGWTEKELLEVK
jgi:putative membrane-bound dehydrogenase-like protein